MSTEEMCLITLAACVLYIVAMGAYLLSDGSVQRTKRSKRRAK